jgi:hypothetical protein
MPHLPACGIGVWRFCLATRRDSPEAESAIQSEALFWTQVMAYTQTSPVGASPVLSVLSALSALLTGRERNGQNSAESCRGLARYNGKFSLDGGSRSRGLVWRRVNADGPGLRVGNPHQARTWTISVVAPCCTSPIHSNLIYWDGACFLGGIFCGRCRVRENPKQEADLPRQESSGSSGGISCVIQMLESPRPWT